MHFTKKSNRITHIRTHKVNEKQFEFKVQAGMGQTGNKYVVYLIAIKTKLPNNEQSSWLQTHCRLKSYKTFEGCVNYISNFIHKDNETIGGILAANGFKIISKGSRHKVILKTQYVRFEGKHYGTLVHTTNNSKEINQFNELNRFNARPTRKKYVIVDKGEEHAYNQVDVTANNTRINQSKNYYSSKQDRTNKVQFYAHK